MFASRYIDLTGKRFGKLCVIRFNGLNKHSSATWLCRCDCGVEKVIDGNPLRRGVVKSCNCSIGGKTHGIGHTAFYSAWFSMISRCYNPKRNDYRNYGGRGIRVCEFLRASPINLLQTVGEKPNRGMSLDRRNNEGHYSCGACSECFRCGYPLNIRWATAQQQCRNTRFNRMLTVGTETRCCKEWAEISGIKYHTFYARLRRGRDPFINRKEQNRASKQA